MNQQEREGGAQNLPSSALRRRPSGNVESPAPGESHEAQSECLNDFIDRPGTCDDVMTEKTAFADPGTLPPGQLPAFTAEWWQWALSIPKSRNPLFDTTGENCMIGQRDVVWFLAGTLFGGSATRRCSVPEDKTLFFPVINISFFNSPNLCGQNSQSFTVAEQRTAIKPIIDAATNLSVTVDGIQVKKTLLQRVQSEVFDVVLPDDNVFLPDFPPCPAGIYSPTVDDGFERLAWTAEARKSPNTLPFGITRCDHRRHYLSFKRNACDTAVEGSPTTTPVRGTSGGRSVMRLEFFHRLTFVKAVPPEAA